MGSSSDCAVSLTEEFVPLAFREGECNRDLSLRTLLLVLAISRFVSRLLAFVACRNSGTSVGLMASFKTAIAKTLRTIGLFVPILQAEVAVSFIRWLGLLKGGECDCKMEPKAKFVGIKGIAA